MTSIYKSIKVSITIVVSMIAAACGTPNNVSVKINTPLPPNTNEMTLISEASQESGLDGVQVCEMLTEGLVDFFFSERGRNLTCGLSAFSASFAVPEDSAELCESVYNGCSENYTATVDCNQEFTQKLNACPVSLGLWQQCVDEQSALLNAAGEQSLSCNDLSEYASSLSSVAKRYQVPACEEIQRTCPDLDLGSTSDALESLELNGEDTDNNESLETQNPNQNLEEDDLEDDWEDDSEDDFEDDSEDDWEDDSEDDWEDDF